MPSGKHASIKLRREARVQMLEMPYKESLVPDARCGRFIVGFEEGSESIGRPRLAVCRR
jgi:hypothetical protein